MPHSMIMDGGDDGVDIDMDDAQFLLSLKPASKENELEEKILRIAEGRARDGLDISVNDALDYIASITKMGKIYYQARAAFVWQYLQNLMQKGSVSSSEILNSVLDRLDSPSADFLYVACTIMHDLMPTFDVANSIKVASKVMSISSSFPDALAPREWDSIQDALRLLHSVISSPLLPANPHWTMEGWLIPYQKRLSRLCCFFTPSGHREMSTITGLFTLDAAASTPANQDNKEKEKEKEKDNKDKQTTTTTTTEERRVDVARYTPSPTWGRAWHTCVNVVYHLICQGAALEWIQAHLRIFGQIMESHDYLTPPLPATNTAVPPPAPPKSAASQLLLDAAILRVLQLIEKADEEVKGKTMEQLMDGFWGEWCCFADQFYVWVEIGLLDYEKFVLTLAEKHTKTGSHIRDNAIIWLLALEHVKEMFRSELMIPHGPHFGRVFPFVLSLFNESQLQENKTIQLRDTAVLCFAIRLYGIIGPSPSPTPSASSSSAPVAPSVFPYNEVKKYITRMSEQLGQKVQYRVQEYKGWWTRSENEKEKIDYFNAPEPVLSKVCVLSTSMSQPISISIMEFMVSTAPPDELASEPGQPSIPHFPGFLSFSGRIRPFSLSFLSQLAIRCRQRLLDMILACLMLEAKLEATHVPANMPIPPGMMENFVRLLYITPSASRIRYRIHTALQNTIANDLRANAIFDVINFRLIRFFKPANGHQLTESILSLLIKLCVQLNEVVRFAKNVATVNLGETVNRLLVLSLARVIKTRGVYDYTRLKDIPQLLTRLYEVSPHMWSSNTQKYFPPIIRSFYSPPPTPPPSSSLSSSSSASSPSQLFPPTSVSSPSIPFSLSFLTPSSSSSGVSPAPVLTTGFYPPPPNYSSLYLSLPQISQINTTSSISVATFQKVAEELEQNGQFFNAMDQHIHSFVSHFQSWAQNKPLFLCEVWMYILRNGGQSPIERFVHAIFYSFTPQEVSACTPLQPRPISRVDPAQRRHVIRDAAAPDKLREACNLLSNFVYAWHILPLETTLFALMDRDDDPNAFSLLDFLLIESPQINQRLDSFLAFKFNRDLWREDTYFHKNTGYNTTFQDFFFNKTPLPIYYGNICLRLLPVLDILFRRLIENDQGQRLERYFERYHKLYVYHDTPISNVSDIIFYYYDAPLFTETPDVRLKLLRLLEGAHGSLAEKFKEYMYSKKIELIASPEYFESVLNRVESVINVHQIQSPFYNSTQLHFFHEFPSASEGCLVTTSMELMLNPLSPKDIASGLLSCITGKTEVAFVEGTSFQKVAAIALLFSRLPAVFQGYLFEYTLRGIKESPHFEAVGKLGTTARALFVDFSANSESLMNNPVNTSLVLLHNFFTHSSVETLNIYPSFLRALRPMKNIHYFFVACKLIAPFLKRISTHPHQDLLHEILVELMKAFKDIEGTLVDDPVRDSLYDDYTNPNTIFDIVIDFLYHCKTMFNLKAHTMAAIREIIFSFKPQVQMQFKHF